MGEIAALIFQHWQKANYLLIHTASLGFLVNENYQEGCIYGWKWKSLGSTVLAQFKNYFSVPNDYISLRTLCGSSVFSDVQKIISCLYSTSLFPTFICPKKKSPCLSYQSPKSQMQTSVPDYTFFIASALHSLVQ